VAQGTARCILRFRFDDTVEQIKRKLTPGQLIDEVLQQGGEPARNALLGLGKTIVAHPIPALLLGTAVVWLALETRSEKPKPHEATGP
jgi:hypothetical protein